MLHPTHFPSTSGTATTASSRDFARTKRGIDHESYAYQLALDIGSAPTAAHVLAEHGWRVWLVWAMGPSFTTKFRMVGPWRMSKQEVEAIMEGELWGVVRRTGGAVCESCVLLALSCGWFVVCCETAADMFPWLVGDA